MKHSKKLIVILFSLFILSACHSPGNLSVASSITPTLYVEITPSIPVITKTHSPAVTPAISQLLFTSTPEPRLPAKDFPTIVQTPTPKPNLCSPLKGIQLQELGTILSNPYTASRVGFDEGHPGIDFAYWSRGERKSMQGHPIQSTFRGRVTSIINNRSPYGNSIIIETPLSQVPSTVQSILSRLAEIPAVIPDARLYCPGFRLPAINPPPRNSIYTLYGHLNHPSPLQVGETVECGMDIGEVGTTGFSVNHHLHLEMRAGPSGAQIESMAHYDNGASPSEMVSYCAWRASGIFISIDPILILGIAH